MAKPKKSNLNAVDKLVSFFSPARGIRRARMRALESNMIRAYEGASKTHRTSGWKAGPGSADTEAAFSLQILRNRSRDLVRNDALAARAVQVITANTIGCGILLKASHQNPKRAQLAQGLWKEWAETAACDFANSKNFYAMQSLG